MERLWSPWRMQYLTATGQTEGCFLCAAAAAEDDGGRLYLGSGVIVVLNAFPYNTGHLLVSPVRHCSRLDELTGEERTHVMETVTRCTSALAQAMGPDAFNVGANLGAAAGAGVPGHLHFHVVPRWSGDTNFMPVVAETKVLPEMLADTAAKLRPYFDGAA